jgi:hypothetical protein
MMTSPDFWIAYAIDKSARYGILAAMTRIVAEIESRAAFADNGRARMTKIRGAL